jgi:hypothetical protein
MATVEDQSLIDLLMQLSLAAKPHFEHYAKNQHDFGIKERAEWFAAQPSPQLFENVRKSLQTALENHPVFGVSEGRFFGSKQLMIHPHYAAYNLLRVSLERGPAGAISWLCKVYSTNKADLRYVVEVHGLKLDKQIALSNGVRLVPLAQLPPSPQANGLIAQYDSFPSVPNARPMFPPIGAIFEVLDVCALTDFEESRRKLGPRSMELERTIRAFALEGEAAPILGIGWLEFIDPDIALAEYGQMWMSPIRESDVSIGRHPTDANQLAIDWVERYIDLESNLKRVCDVAIERLALARCRYYPGNKAIEGAICLEALLGDGGNQELTYRLRLRAALLLGKNLNERREISRAINDFYDLRSKTVHGRATSLDEAAENACVKRGIEICADALRAIVKLNRKYIPQDWELSGGAPAEPDH